MPAKLDKSYPPKRLELGDAPGARVSIGRWAILLEHLHLSPFDQQRQRTRNTAIKRWAGGPAKLENTLRVQIDIT